MTHTFAILEVSQACYDEIRGKLAAAGYQHAFLDEGVEVIDMHGVALKSAPQALIDEFGNTGIVQP
jgi:hypothetical protein